MNENPDSLYRQTLAPRRNAYSLWVGAAIIALVGATSLYISRAGSKQDPPPQTTSIVAAHDVANSAKDAANKTTEIKNMSDAELHKKLTKTRTNQQKIEHFNHLAHKTRTFSILACFQKFL